MPDALTRCAPACLLLAFVAVIPAHAAQVVRVDVRGLDEAMTGNVRETLSLSDEVGNELSDRRLKYLIDETERETREALEPFGFYAPTVRVTLAGGVVTVDVQPGEPVRVRTESVRIDGEGGSESVLRGELDAFKPKVGEVLDHVAYEASKARISGTLAERGYFDADIAAHRVEVTRATQSADINVAWNSGTRYRMGSVSFTQTPTIIDERILQKLAFWKPGVPYHQDRVERLRETLQRLDYFSGIDVQVHPENAVDKRVPVDVVLTPAKRSVYTAGLSYGSDSGAGVRLGVDRRYLNSRGHKATAQLDFAQRRRTLTLQYRIPAFALLDGWYTIATQAADEQTDFIDTRRVELIASRSGKVNRELELLAGVHVLRERWAYAAEDDGDPRTPPDYRYASFAFPSLDATYIKVDNRLLPRRGFGATAFLRGGAGNADAGQRVLFGQAHGSLSWFHGLGPQSRLITRGELGRTWSDTPVGTLPPSLRFHAGGERSIRGYGWREVGPRVGAQGQRFPVGARNVVTASAEYEQYFRPQWGAAVFVDTGSAFNARPDLHTGIGVGLRWKSPVGPARIDIAHGLNSADSPFQIYFGLGADL